MSDVAAARSRRALVGARHAAASSVYGVEPVSGVAAARGRRAELALHRQRQAVLTP